MQKRNTGGAFMAALFENTALKRGGAHASTMPRHKPRSTPAIFARQGTAVKNPKTARHANEMAAKCRTHNPATL